MNHQVIHPKKEILDRIMNLRFYTVRTASEPHRAAPRCGSEVSEPRKYEVRCAVLGVRTGTAPRRGLVQRREGREKGKLVVVKMVVLG